LSITKPVWKGLAVKLTVRFHCSILLYSRGLIAVLLHPNLWRFGQCSSCGAPYGTSLQIEKRSAPKVTLRETQSGSDSAERFIEPWNSWEILHFAWSLVNGRGQTQSTRLRRLQTGCKNEDWPGRFLDLALRRLNNGKA
jgi:hypothetical protein